MITPEPYTRRGFEVDAVQVSSENMEEVAEWCLGTIEIQKRPTKRGEGGFVKEVPYLKVDVLRPLNVRQTMAFPGDWILKTGTSFKIYTDIAFHKNFMRSNPETPKQDDFNVPFEQLSDFMIFKDGEWQPLTMGELRDELAPIIRATMEDIKREQNDEMYAADLSRAGVPQVKLGGITRPQVSDIPPTE